MSILTSRYRWELEEGDWSSAVTLAELLKDAGYCTLAVVQNPNLDRSLGFDQGFDAYVEIHEREPTDALLAILARRVPRLARGGRPLFLFLHVQEPHWPYRGEDRDAARFLAAGTPPIAAGEVDRLMRTNGAGWDPAASDAAAKVGRMLDLYDLDIHLADRSLGGIEALLDAHGLWGESLVVFNSDHGDEFGDHGAFGHAHRNVHPELTRVPFVLRFPAALGVAPARVPDVVRNLDLMPTVLAVLGIESPVELSGRSLWPLSSASGEELALSYASRVVALRDGAHALLVDYGREPPEPRFYDRGADPMERAPLAEKPEAFERFAARAAAWNPDYERAGAPEASTEAGAQELDPDLLKRLEDLGYL
jgi:arylsulfatase A-like enzyme